MRRAAVYLRVSSDNGRQTTENQRADVLQMVTARGYEPVVYEENESAAKARPALDAMLRGCACRPRPRRGGLGARPGSTAA